MPQPIPYWAVKIEYHHGVANYIECKDEGSAQYYLDDIKRDINSGKRVYHYLEGKRLISLEAVRNISIIDHDEGYYPIQYDFDTGHFKK